MRKLSVYMLSAAAAMTIAGAMPVSAYAATSTYQVPGGKMIVIGGNNTADLSNILNQIGGGMKLPDCDTNMPAIPGGWLPDMSVPGGNLPDAGIPDNSLPTPEQPSPDGPEDTTPEQPGGNTSMDAYAKKVVDLVNAERAKAGLSPLSINETVALAAQTRAREIETSFSHTRPNGSSFSTVLTSAGVTYRGAGENIAYGQQSPEQVMESWMNSSGHRANILNSSFTSIGVGHYKNAAGVDYWTQLFIN